MDDELDLVQGNSRRCSAGSNRRTFLKHLGGLGLFGLGGLARTAHASTAGRYPSPLSKPIAEPPWRRTIFCQFDRSLYARLAEDLERCADEIDGRIVWGEHSTPVPVHDSFAQVIDRNAVAHDVWTDYVAACPTMLHWNLCLLLDTREDLPRPEWTFSRRFYPSQYEVITRFIREMRTEIYFACRPSSRESTDRFAPWPSD